MNTPTTPAVPVDLGRTMRRRTAWLLAVIMAVLAFVIGAAVGGAAVGYHLIKLSAKQIVPSNLANANINVTALSRLRAGKTTNAIELLEITLDSNLSGLSYTPEEADQIRSNPTYVKILQRAKQYRAEYPRKTQFPITDEAVARTLQIVNDAPPEPEK